MSETDGTEPWTDSEQLEAIERELKIAKRSNSIAVYVRVDALRVVADHARRSVEAEAKSHRRSVLSPDELSRRRPSVDISSPRTSKVWLPLVRPA